MSNDTVVNRVSNSDSNTLYRKSKSDQIDIRKISFFEELINIGVFESSIGPSNHPLPSIDAGKSKGNASNDSDRIASDRKVKDYEDSQSANDVSEKAIDYSNLIPNQQPLAVPTIAPQDSTQVPVASLSISQKPTGHESPTEATVTTPNSPSNALPQDSNQQLPLPLSGTSEKLANELNGLRDNEDLNKPSTESVTSDASGLVAANAKGNPKRDKVSTAETSTKPHAPRPSANATSEPTKIAKDTRHNGVVNAKGPTVDSAVQAGSSQSQDGSPRNRRAERLADAANGNNTSRDEHSTPQEKLQSIEANRSTQGDTSSNSQSEPSRNNASAIDSNFNATSAAFGISPIDNIAASIGPVPSPTVVAALGTINAAGSGGAATLSSIGAIGQGPVSTTNTTLTGPTTSTNAHSTSGNPEVARSASGSSISPYQEVKLVQRVLRGLEQLGDGGGQVKLRLHPPELGTLQLTLRMEAGQMFARMEVETTAAKDALLNNLQTLKDRLAGQGMQVESFEVQVASETSYTGSAGSNLQQNGGSGSDSRWENASSRFAQLNDNRLSSEIVPADRLPQQAWTRTNGKLDLTV